MGLLDRAINFAKNAYNYVENAVTGGDEAKSDAAKTTSSKNSSKNKVVNSTFEKKTTEVSPNVDTVKISKPKSTPQSKVVQNNNVIKTKQDIDAKLKEITLKCKKFNISFEEARKNILENMDFSVEEFNKLSNSEKSRVLISIEAALDAYIVDKNKYNKDVDAGALIGQSAKNIELAISEGGIKDHKEFKKYIAEASAQLEIKLSEAKNDEEKINIIKEFRQEFKANIESERQTALKKCKSEEAKNKVNARYSKRLQALEMQIAVEFNAINGPESAYMSSYLVDGKNYGKVVKNSINVFNGEAKTAAANSHTFERRMEVLKHHHEIGEDISADTYKEGVQCVAQNMSYDVLKQDEQDAYNFRLEHQDNLPEYITKEHLTAQSAAYGVGAALNENLTTEQKVEFLKTWDEHAQKFDDYAEVKEQYNTGLKQYIEKHPEAKKGIEELKTKYQEKYGETAKVSKSAQKHSNAGAADKVQHAEKAKPEENDTALPKATVQQLEHALMTKSYDEVRELYSMNSEREFAEVILHNPKLKGHKLRIVGFMKTLSPEDLYNVTKGINTEMFLFVLRNISPDKAGRLYDLSKGDKCYSARMLGEKIIEEGQSNAAA